MSDVLLADILAELEVLNGQIADLTASFYAGLHFLAFLSACALLGLMLYAKIERLF